MNITKITAMAVLAMLAGASAPADELRPNAERTATVCLEKSDINDSMPFARRLASKMFDDIGVTIRWSLPPDACPAQGIPLKLVRSTPRDFDPGTLAYTQLHEGVCIRIFYDRIIDRHDIVQVRILEAHVLVHEITHVLQGTSRHSAYGVMKADWDYFDFRSMAGKRLAFTKNDVDLIYRGLARRGGHSETDGKSRDNCGFKGEK
jgi:hypothetical protein